jgi:hypothetical protein
VVNKQPEALRLADLLEKLADEAQNWQLLETSAKELRRLYAVNQEQLEVLKAILNDGLHCDVVPHLHRKARAAIAKATGETE